MDPIICSGSSLDRVSELRRDAAWVEQQLVHPGVRFLPLWGLKPLVKLAVPRSLAWTTRAFLAELGSEEAAARKTILLGVEDGIPHFTVDVSDLPEPEQRLGVAEAAKFEELMTCAAQLPSAQAAIAAHAGSLVVWHANHGFCPACGSETTSRQGGAMRMCIDCSMEHFPRTNPAAISMVADGDRCLLGRNKGWPSRLHSALAGFIEPGEAIEEAVQSAPYISPGKVRADR